METLIVQPKTKEQLVALKAFIKALKIDFKTEKGTAIKKKYNFSDLAGKLEWEGDALAEQKKLRAEWD